MSGKAGMKGGGGGYRCMHLVGIASVHRDLRHVVSQWREERGPTIIRIVPDRAQRLIVPDRVQRRVDYLVHDLKK